MKQILLRVPDDVHRRLAARAEREGRSVNSLATEVLDAAAGADVGDRQARLRAKAASLGMLQELPAEPVSAEQRRAAIESTRGIGPFVDAWLDYERGRM